MTPKAKAIFERMCKARVAYREAVAELLELDESQAMQIVASDMFRGETSLYRLEHQAVAVLDSMEPKS